MHLKYMRDAIRRRSFSRQSQLTIVFAIFLLAQVAATGAAPGDDWPHYGGHLDGTRFAASAIVTPKNVRSLEEAWVFQTGDVANGGDEYFGRTSSFKATPILIDNKLVFSSGFNRVYAIDPATGEQLWRFDPEVNFARRYSEMFTSRGVAGWVDDEAASGDACASRIFLGTLDARLIAIDAQTGLKCSGFGDRGEVDLSKGITNFRRGEYSMTSPPTVVNGVVVAGSSVGDNGGVRLDSGLVRAFDARSGALRWTFDPIPRNDASPGWATWEQDSGHDTGAANVWGVMAADAQRDLVFLPTTSPSPDFYGGERLGDNAYANSVVALRASTGEFVWGYQLVHHDLWDYDLAAQPLLMDVEVDGKSTPALLQATKMGFIFVLDRRTGEPLHEVEERPVPASNVPGERSAKTQRFPVLKLHAVSSKLPAIWQHSKEHVHRCEKMLAGVRFDGIFTPPSLEGTLLYPGNPGGTNWGSMAAHPPRGMAFVVINRLPTVVKVIPRKDFSRQASEGRFNGVEAQFTAQGGTPFGMARFELYNPDKVLPCLEGPWATLVAIDVASERVAWERPLGYFPGTEDDPEAMAWGGFGYGGPLATAGGIVFAASRLDAHLRAFDMRDGTELWDTSLPAQPQGTPMSYARNGAQYVVVAAGGARADGQGQGDYLIAYKVAGQEAPETTDAR